MSVQSGIFQPPPDLPALSGVQLVHLPSWQTRKSDLVQPRSRHLIPSLETRHRRAAHIYGGTVTEFLRLSEACSNWTLVDRAHGIQAAVDDESYLQRWACCRRGFMGLRVM